MADLRWTDLQDSSIREDGWSVWYQAGEGAWLGSAPDGHPLRDGRGKVHRWNSRQDAMAALDALLRAQRVVLGGLWWVHALRDLGFVLPGGLLICLVAGDRMADRWMAWWDWPGTEPSP